MGWQCPKLQLWIWQDEVGAKIPILPAEYIFSQVFSTLLSGLRDRDPVLVVEQMIRHGDELKN